MGEVSPTGHPNLPEITEAAAGAATAASETTLVVDQVARQRIRQLSQQVSERPRERGWRFAAFGQKIRGILIRLGLMKPPPGPPPLSIELCRIGENPNSTKDLGEKNLEDRLISELRDTLGNEGDISYRELSQNKELLKQWATRMAALERVGTNDSLPKKVREEAAWRWGRLNSVLETFKPPESLNPIAAAVNLQSGFLTDPMRGCSLVKAQELFELFFITSKLLGEQGPNVTEAVRVWCQKLTPKGFFQLYQHLQKLNNESEGLYRDLINLIPHQIELRIAELQPEILSTQDQKNYLAERRELTEAVGELQGSTNIVTNELTRNILLMNTQLTQLQENIKTITEEKNNLMKKIGAQKAVQTKQLEERQLEKVISLLGELEKEEKRLLKEIKSNLDEKNALRSQITQNMALAEQLKDDRTEVFQEESAGETRNEQYMQSVALSICLKHPQDSRNSLVEKVSVAIQQAKICEDLEEATVLAKMELKKIFGAEAGAAE